MKKILFAVLFLFSITKIYAIENIKINGDNLSPYFDNKFHKYNYFTNEDNILIEVKNENNEIINGDGLYTLNNSIEKFIITSNIHGEYEINVYKNYKKQELHYGELLNLKIKNHDIDFKKDKYEYDISINDEDMLDIEYELLNPNSYVDIKGNGNFNNTNNIIEINVDDINIYKINVHKTIKVSENIDNNVEVEEISPIKKEIAKLSIIAISCSLIFSLYYILFIKKLF